MAAWSTAYYSDSVDGTEENEGLIGGVLSLLSRNKFTKQQSRMATKSEQQPVPVKSRPMPISKTTKSTSSIYGSRKATDSPVGRTDDPKAKRQHAYDGWWQLGIMPPDEESSERQNLMTSPSQWRITTGSDIVIPQSPDIPPVHSLQAETDIVKQKHHQGQPKAAQASDGVDELTEHEKELMEVLKARTMEKKQLADEKQNLQEKIERQNKEILVLRDQVKQLMAELGVQKQTKWLKQLQPDSADKMNEDHQTVLQVSECPGTEQQQISQLKTELDKIREHSKAQSRKVLELRQEAHATELHLKEQVESYYGLYEDAEEQIGHLQKDLSKTRSELERTSSELQTVVRFKESLENELKVTKEEAFHRSQKYEELIAENKQLREQIIKLSEHVSASNEQQRKIFQLENEKAEITSQLESVQAQATSYQSDFNEERKDRERAQGNVADLEMQNSHLQKDLGETRSELEKVVRYKESLENKLKVKKEETFQRSHKHQELIAENEQLRGQIVKLSESISASNEQQRKIYQLENEKAEITSQLEGVQAQVSIFKADFAEERKDREKAHSKLADLQKELAQQQFLFAEEKAEYIRQLTIAHQEAEDGNIGKHKKTQQKKQTETLTDVYWQDQAAALQNQLKETQQYVSELEQARSDVVQMKQENQAKEDQIELLRKELEKKSNDLDKVTKNLQQSERRAVEAKQRAHDLERQIQDVTQKATTTVVDELAPFKLHFDDPLPANKQVGSGSYGTVYAVEVDGIQFIAKRVQDILLGKGGQEKIGAKQRKAIEEKFRKECILLSKIRHPNIVQFMGVRYGQNMYDLTLVMERLPMDLQKCLERCQADKYFIPLSIRFSILLDVTYGLLHLHNQSILHRDLTAGNVLLTSNMQAKIADLGVSRIVESRHSQKLSALPGTIGYMPPEALQDEPEYSQKLDIFSFGVLALFVALQTFPNFSWQNVPDDIVSKGEAELYKRRKWITKIGERHKLYPLICRCLQDNSEARPSTGELNATMKDLCTNSLHRLQDVTTMLNQLDLANWV